MTARHRSLLFVSGERPDRFDKAMASGADVVCIDLEDAVGPAAKDSAREAVVAFVLARAKAPGTVRLAIRINAVGTLHGLRDVLALAAGRAAPDTLLVPKVESPRDAVCRRGRRSMPARPFHARLTTCAATSALS